MLETDIKNFLQQLFFGGHRARYGAWYFREPLFKPKRSHPEAQYYGGGKNLFEWINKIHNRFCRPDNNTRGKNLFKLKNEDDRDDEFAWCNRIIALLEADNNKLIEEIWTPKERKNTEPYSHLPPMYFKYSVSFSIPTRSWKNFLTNVLVPTFMETYVKETEDVYEDGKLNKPLSKKEILWNMFVGGLHDNYTDIRRGDSLLNDNFFGDNLLQCGSYIGFYCKKTNVVKPKEFVDGEKPLSGDWTQEGVTMLLEDEELRVEIWGEKYRDYDDFYKKINNHYFMVSDSNKWQILFDKVLYPMFDKYFEY